MSYSPEDLLPLSALQHYAYCPRQCALIHLEQIWTENLFTAEGRILHEQADSGQSRTRGEIRIAYSVPLRSLSLGLAGVADTLEFRREGDKWLPYPVEYKRGRPKKHDADKIQLCAQAICLEEMLGLEIPEGALFYGKTRRRQVVALDESLRAKTWETALLVHELFQGLTRTEPLSGDLPKSLPKPLHNPLPGPLPNPLPEPLNDERCGACSLAGECLPEAASRSEAGQYLEALRGG